MATIPCVQGKPAVVPEIQVSEILAQAAASCLHGAITCTSSGPLFHLFL